MSKTTSELVADIKTRYKRANSDKLAIQKDMVALRDKHGWTQQQIADKTGIPRATVAQWLTAYDEGISAGFAEVSKLTPSSQHRASDRAVAKRVFATHSMEEIEHVLEKLPPARVREIAAAAGNAYHREAASVRGPRTEREQREIDNAARTLTRPVAQAAAGFASLGIVGHIEQATEELNELVADGSLTPKLVKQIERAWEKFSSALEMAGALAGGD